MIPTKVIELFKRIERNQEIIMKQNWYKHLYDIWSSYSEELREIKEMKKTKKPTPRQEEAGVFYLGHIYLGHHMKHVFTDEEWTLIESNVKYWLSFSMIKYLGRSSYSWFPKDFKEFIDGLMK